MTVYIDPSLTSDGSGSFANPRNTVAAFNNLTGDQSGEAILIKRGTTTDDRIINTSAFNFRLGSYGESGHPLPIIPAYAQDYSVYLSGGNDISVFSLDLIDAIRTGLLIQGTTCNNLRISNLTIRNVNGTGAQDAINIKPANLSTGVYIAGNRTLHCVGNSIEVGKLTAPVIVQNYSDDCFQCIELWETVTDALVEANKFINSKGRAVWLANGGSAGQGQSNEIYTGNIIRNNQFLDVISGPEVQANIGAGLITATGNQFYHNTLVIRNGGSGFKLDAGSSHTVQNNIFYQRADVDQIGGPSDMVRIALGAEVGSSIDGNYYYSADPRDALSDGKFKFNGTTQQNINNWIANGPAGIDKNCSGGTDPGFVDLANNDVRLTATSPCLYDNQLPTGAVVSGISTEDYNRDPRYTDNDQGALQYKRLPETIGSISL